MPRESLHTACYSRLNRVLHLGFDYRGGKVLERSLSSRMYAEPKRAAVLRMFSEILEHIIDRVKDIKKSRNFALHKDYRDFN